MDSTSAILINRSRLTETSLIVHWCSVERGLFKTAAKGALRPRSPLAGRLDLFVTCDVVLVPARTGDLHILKEAHITAPRLHLRESYARVIAATYFCKLVEMVSEREAPLGGIGELLRLGLDYLDAHEPSARLVQRFENKLCDELGLGSGAQNSAAVLQQYLHRALPPQRAALMTEISRDSAQPPSRSDPFDVAAPARMSDDRAPDSSTGEMTLEKTSDAKGAGQAPCAGDAGGAAPEDQ